MHTVQIDVIFYGFSSSGYIFRIYFNYSADFRV